MNTIIARIATYQQPLYSKVPHLCSGLSGTGRSSTIDQYVRRKSNSRSRVNFQYPLRFLSTSSAARRPVQSPGAHSEQPQGSKRKSNKSTAAKSSLRRVAVEAQRSREAKNDKQVQHEPQTPSFKTITAVCAAEKYDIEHVASILASFGHEIDPYKTNLFPQVIHVPLPVQSSLSDGEDTTWSTGDLFIFPSGTVVAWAIPEDQLESLVTKALVPAAQEPLKEVEEEDLEYFEDPKREGSSIRGDRIILGTKSQQSDAHLDSEGRKISLNEEPKFAQSRNLDTVLAKIAFSSGLARSTKLAVLERLLDDYFESTKSIPAVLSRGGRMPFTRNFISQKTGQLLEIRAQLNLYSELTDSLPDLFWDSRHELGLEGYYDQVGKALDTNIRIKVLNEKMDYASEIASVLRQQLSEKHSVRLEWIIILLIAVEVVFAIEREVKEFRDRTANGQGTVAS